MPTKRITEPAIDPVVSDTKQLDQELDELINGTPELDEDPTGVDHLEALLQIAAGDRTPIDLADIASVHITRFGVVRVDYTDHSRRSFRIGALDD